MKITIEISNYPLTDDYLPQITDFIDRCIATGITTKVNATSTHLQGEYDEVMNVLQQEIKTSYEKYGQMIFVVKVLKGELDLNYKH
ncbi:MAG: thiamine-binding protein [Flavobacteriales bacterium]|nr:thiamine-binding protein [Flavobacteriales bacterium]